MKFLRALISFTVLVVAIVFALYNRDPVTLNLWPFGYEAAAPAYILVSGSLVIGLLLGAGFIWLGHLPHRRLTKKLGKDVVVLSDKILELERELEPHRAAARLMAPQPSPTKIKWRFWEK